MIKFSSCLFFCLTLSIYTVFAQSSDRQKVNQSAQWLGITANTKISKRLTLVLEGQFRQVGNFDPQQYQLRAALDVKINDHFSIAPLGYVYTWNYRYGKQPAAFANNEHRIWQQICYKHTIGSLYVDHRLRLEERFIESHTTGIDGRVTNEGYVNKQTRFRYKLTARLPLNGSKIGPKSYFLSVYDEIFVSRGERVTYYDPDQNRVFAGMGYQFGKSLTIQTGLFCQTLIKKNGAEAENNIGLQVNVTYNIDCTKRNH